MIFLGFWFICFHLYIYIYIYIYISVYFKACQNWEVELDIDLLAND